MTERMPVPAESLWSLPRVALKLGVSHRYVRTLAIAAKFPCRRYGRDGKNMRLFRLFTEAEIAVLAALRTRSIITVKENLAGILPRNLAPEVTRVQSPNGRTIKTRDEHRRTTRRARA